jgi:heme/copper-type cytochrome/quinol oxidase subunit 4
MAMDQDKELLGRLAELRDGIEATFPDQRKALALHRKIRIRQAEQNEKEHRKVRRYSWLGGLIAGIFLAASLTVALMGLADSAVSGSTISLMLFFGCLFFLYAPVSIMKNGYIRISKNKIVQLVLFLCTIFLVVPLLLLSVMILINAVITPYTPVYALLAAGPGGGILLGLLAARIWQKKLAETIRTEQDEKEAAVRRIQKVYANLKEQNQDWYPDHCYSCIAVECFTDRIHNGHLSAEDDLAAVYRKSAQYGSEISTLDELDHELKDPDRDTGKERDVLQRVNLSLWDMKSE